MKITNVPYYLGLSEEDLKKIVSKFIEDNFLNDTGNQNPVQHIEINQEQNHIIIEVSSVEEANRLLKLKFITVLNVECKIHRLTDTLYGEDTTLKKKLQEN